MCRFGRMSERDHNRVFFPVRPFIAASMITEVPNLFISLSVNNPVSFLFEGRILASNSSEFYWKLKFEKKKSLP